jgi:hypothetical protein
MVNYLREIVSGKKARFVDHETNLDLVYVTDRILMYVIIALTVSRGTDVAAWAGPLLGLLAYTEIVGRTC